MLVTDCHEYWRWFAIPNFWIHYDISTDAHRFLPYASFGSNSVYNEIVRVVIYES